MRRSRLSKKTEKNTKKTIILSVLGIIIILFLLFKFGIAFLINFSLFITGSNRNQQSNTNKNEISFIAAPVLNPVSQATNSAQIIITGTTEKNQDVYLYINNSQVDQVVSSDKGIFKFIENLEKGSNQINAKVKRNDKESDFSNTLSISYQTSQPKLEVTSPSDGQQFKKDQNTAKVTGKTDFGVSVTVNGFWAQIDDANDFSYNLALQNGDNQIKIVATDQAGNKSEKELRVNYSQ